MKKLTLTITATAIVFGSMILSASAQMQAPAAAGLHAQVQNATPIVKNVACQGWGAHCSPGFVWTCNYTGCWCRPCR